MKDWVSMKRDGFGRRLWVAAMMFLAVSASGVGSLLAGDNLAPNGGFENGDQGQAPKDWVMGKHYGKRPPGARVELDSTVHPEGAKSLKVVSVADDIPVIVQSKAIELKPGGKYVLSLAIRADRDGVDARMFALATNFRKNFNSSLSLSKDWKTYRLVFQVPKNGPTKYWIRFDLMEKGILWADDVRLTVYDPNDTSNQQYIGYRRSKTPGDKEVEIKIGTETGKNIPDVSGVCFCYGFGAKNLDPRFKELGLRVVRIHNVLTNYRIIKRDAAGKFSYDFSALDQVIDRTLEIGAVPEMNLCFVPLQLVNNPNPAKIRKSYDGFYLGPPSDFKQWEEFISQVVRHCKDKYGDITGWYWIFGNEPSVEKQFSMGTQEDYYQLYLHTLKPAIQIEPKIKIGAGSFASQLWLKKFVRRCGEDGTRLDLISWHHYGLVPEDYSVKISKVRSLVNEYPGLGNPKLIIDEWNPWLPDHAPAYLAAGDYAAAHAVASIREMMKEGLDYQTFFISHSVYDWGMIGKKGEIHPTFNAMKMLRMMGRKELSFAGPQADPYIGGFAAGGDDGTVTVLNWYAKYRYDTSENFDKKVTVVLPFDADQAGEVMVYLIDRDHSNGLTNPDRQQLETLTQVVVSKTDTGKAKVTYQLKPNSVALVVAKPGK